MTTNCPFAGIAAISISTKTVKQFRTSSFASIFTCEVIAIIAALDLAIAKNSSSIVIFSDSQSALKALQNYNVTRNKSYLLMEILKRVDTLYKKNVNVKFFWIPAHVGIEFNEQADLVAKQAITAGIDSSFLVPWQDFSAKWKEVMFEDLDKFCIELSRSKAEGIGARFFMYYFRKSKKKWFEECDLNRKALVSINRLRSNHSSLASSLFRHDIVNSPRCPCDLEDQSEDHIFWRCLFFAKAREILLKQIKDLKFTKPLLVCNLLHSNKPKIYEV